MNRNFLQHILYFATASLIFATLIKTPLSDDAKTKQGTKKTEMAEDGTWLFEYEVNGILKAINAKPDISPQNDKEKITGNNKH